MIKQIEQCNRTLPMAAVLYTSNCNPYLFHLAQTKELIHTMHTVGGTYSLYGLLGLKIKCAKLQPMVISPLYECSH